jgi:hypothetical protein
VTPILDAYPPTLDKYLPCCLDNIKYISLADKGCFARGHLAVSEESPKDAFIAILRSLSERDQYFYGLNALEDDGI